MTVLGLSIDGGAKGGWALSAGMTIVACGLVRLDKRERMRQFTDLSWVICEDQQLYPTDVRHLGPERSCKKAHDLIVLGRRAAIMCEQAAPGVEVTWVLPHAWKGSVPKETHNERVLKRLTDPERALLHACGCPPVLLNNVIDAIGLNLWMTRRYRP